jgi:hypothetical protein
LQCEAKAAAIVPFVGDAFSITAIMLPLRECQKIDRHRASPIWIEVRQNDRFDEL